jgi:hypothetical protein
MVICEKGPYLAVVADQIAYTQSVRDFVRDLMKRFIPGRWASCVIPDGNDRFTERLDAAFLKVDEATATRGDYCNEVVEVLCAELRSVSATLREVCETRGHREYAERYLSRERFVNMLLERDIATLEALHAALADASLDNLDLMRRIAAILDGKDASGRAEPAAIAESERTAANAELREIASEVRQGISADVMRAIGEGWSMCSTKLDSIGEKLESMRWRGGGRRTKYGAELRERCERVWEFGRRDFELRNSLNTRVTYGAVFARYRGYLEPYGIDTVDKFRKVVHCAQSLASARRAAALAK